MMPIIQTDGENSDLGQGMPSRLRLYMHGGSSKWSKQNHGHPIPASMTSRMSSSFGTLISFSLVHQVFSS